MRERWNSTGTIVWSWLVAATLAILSGGHFAVYADEKPKPTFEEHVLPILKAKCVKCHAGAEPEAGLRLTTSRDILKGGKSGPAMRIKAAESSLIWEKLASNEMPKGGPPLSAEEKGVIRSWINDGALSSEAIIEDGEVESLVGQPVDHWAFRPPIRSPVPAIGTGPVRNPIDAFILQRLQAKGLSLSPDASNEVLLRRATFDLTGLPPTPDERRDFLEDGRPDAYEQLIERLLASPAYGERWGRHWLDVAGYAESAGVLAEDRPIPNAYRYRDYVIRSLNVDKPYDRFLQEQLAGDELTDYWTVYETHDRLPEDVIEGITATGYLRCAADCSRPDFTTIKNADAQYFYPTINDTLQIVASSTMGLTLQCARCHSHKFDPIPQVEYYRLQAIFMTALRPGQWIPQMERKLLVASASQKKAADEHNQNLSSEVARLKKEQADLRSDRKQKLFEKRLAELPEVIRADVSSSLAKAADQRNDVEKYLAGKFQAQLQPDDKTLDKFLVETDPDYKAAVDQRSSSIAGLERQRIHFDEIRALYDQPGAVITPLLRRGDALTPGAPVEPGVLSSLAAPVSFQWSPPPVDARSSGRRLAFARWLTQPNHPLTSRVCVNRIWLQHFGEGIVATPEDFGTLGAVPTHPQLLDWLAREFVESGWSLKHMHRLIMMSSTYRQQSGIVTESPAQKIDPDNRLLWRQRIRRIDAEPLRDALLSVAGKLDRRLHGPSVPVARRGDGEVTIADGQNGRRRSVYVQVIRGNPLTILQAHDQPVMETNCTRRSRSTVSTQALTLMNSDDVMACAQGLAERSLAEAPDDPVAYMTLAAWSRSLDAGEARLLADFITEQQNRHLVQGADAAAAHQRAIIDACHMLLAANEFVYVD